jgi:hypothetical protein
VRLIFGWAQIRTKGLVAAALRFTGECSESGRRVELVTPPDVCAFDLLGMSR